MLTKYNQCKFTAFKALIAYQLNWACFFTAFAMLLYLQIAKAEDTVKPSFFSHVKDTVSQTWASDKTELYIPINTWHNRNFYSAEEIDRFNERPWGLGAGKYRYDEDGDWHGIYAFAFLDSNNDIEPIVGYGFQKVWCANENLRFGVGYTAGVTLRGSIHYAPLPVLAPLFSIKYKQVALQSTYILGGNGFGNILFSWLRVELP